MLKALPPPNRGCWHWLRICGAVVLGVVLVFFMPLPKEVDQPRMYANGDGTVPFGTMFALLVLWFGISVPLVFLSAHNLSKNQNKKKGRRQAVRE